MTDIAIHDDWTRIETVRRGGMRRALRRLRAVSRLLRLRCFSHAADIAFARSTAGSHNWRSEERWAALYVRSRF